MVDLECKTCQIKQSHCSEIKQLLISGAMSNMPAVKVFSLYAAVAVLIDFLLQITCFVALMTLDAKRQQSNQMDLLCCIKQKDNDAPREQESLLYQFMKKFYAPFLLSDIVRPVVVCDVLHIGS